MITAKDLGRRYGEEMLKVDAFAGVFPSQKFLIVQSLRQKGYVVGMTGDGVNDAPALKRADVGIAVLGATDAARGAADIVLTEPGFSTIAIAMVASRRVFARMQNFIIYRVACTAQLLFFFLISCLFFNPHDQNTSWPTYFSVPVVALVTITILNDGTIISVAFDNVNVGKDPQTWNLPALFMVSIAIGSVALISSLMLLSFGLNSHEPDSLFNYLGIPSQTFGQLMCMMYLKISLSDYLSLFNARTRSWFWTRKPSMVVIVAAIMATAAATFLSLFWPFGSQMEGINFRLAAYVWIYCVFWGVLQDVAKVVTYAALARAEYIKPVREVFYVASSDI